MSEHLTFNQITEQQQSRKLPTVLVPMEDGGIEIGTYSSSTKKVHILDKSSQEERHEPVDVSKETLSDQAQEKLATEFGGLALRSTGVAEFNSDSKIEALTKQLDEISKDYDEETKLQLWSYASGELNRAEYALDGDAGSAEGERQKAGRALTELRLKGLVHVANDYLQIMRELTRLRHQ